MKWAIKEKDPIRKYMNKIINDHPKTNKGKLVFKLSENKKLVIRYMYGGMYRITRYDLEEKSKVDLEILAPPKKIAEIIHKEKLRSKGKIDLNIFKGLV